MKKIFAFVASILLITFSQAHAWTLVDPGADSLIGWDNSAPAGTQTTWFTAGTGLEFSGTTIQAKVGTASGTVAGGNHTHTGVYDPAGTGAAAAAAVVSDTVYGAGWDTVSTIAPSKNALYDYLSTLSLASHDHAATYQPLSTNLTTLATPTAWSVTYSDGSGVQTALPMASAGTYLRSTGTTSAPSWEVNPATGIGGTLGSVDTAIPVASGTGGSTLTGSLAKVTAAGSVNIPTGQTFQINGAAHTHNYQAASSNLTNYATVTPSANALSLLSQTYAAMLTSIGAQPLDTDLTSLSGLTLVAGDILYRDGTQLQRLPKGTSGQVLKMGASYPAWGLDLNDGGSGISRWDQIGAPTAALNLSQGNYKTTFTSTDNVVDGTWTMTNTTNPFSYATSFVDYKLSANGDANAFYLRGYDNVTDLKWSIGPEGAFTGYSFETRQSATGGVLDLLEGSGSGTNYVRLKAPDTLAANYLIDLPASAGTMALVPDYTISATTGQTYTFPTATSAIAAVTAPIALGSQAEGDLFYATSATAIARLPKGTSGQLLAQNAALTAPEWIPAPAGTGDFKADGTVPMTGALVSTGNKDIGSTSAEAGNIYIADGKIIYGQNDQSATLTSGAGKFTANAFTVTNALTAGTVNGHTLTTGSSTFTGTAGQTYTFPTTTATLARTDAANTFTGHQTVEGVTSTGATGTGKFVFDGTPTLVTPVIGAATGTSLLATGIVDGTAPLTVTTGDAANLGTTYKSGYTYNNNSTTGNATTYTLPTAGAGLQYCIKNYTGRTGVLTFQTSAAGQYIDLDGTNSATGGLIHSAGAAGDGACVVGVDATHWVAYPQKGTWVLD
jgi:hypothetical protein